MLAAQAAFCGRQDLPYFAAVTKMSTTEHLPAALRLRKANLPASEPGERLEGWKQIAAYLKRDVRTVQRWERSEQFPVRRQWHRKLSSVLAFKREVDRWMDYRCAPQGAEPSRSLAVRYFDNPGNSQKYAYFSEAVVEDLMTDLSKAEGLRVFPRSTMASFRNKNATAVSIGKRLGASHILEGSMRRTPRRVRLNVNLVETRSGLTVWAERYDSAGKEILRIQDDITQSIVGALRLKLARTGGPTKEPVPTTSLRAYDLYLKGRQLFHQFRRKNFERAREMFARAIEVDPRFAAAHAGFADCCSYLYLYWEATRENLEASDSASRKAVQLAPKLAEAHASRGVSLSTLRNYPEAEKEFRLAIRLDPRLYEAHYFYGRACLAQGKYKEAIQPFESAASVRPEDYQAPGFLGTAYIGLGRKAEAAAAYARSIEVAKQQLAVNPGDVRALYLGAVSWARIGHRKEAVVWARKALALDSEDSSVLYNVACLYAVLHRTKEALNCLRGVVRSGWRKEWIKNDPDLVSLHGNAEFQRLLR
jgi:adenylate cyclase